MYGCSIESHSLGESFQEAGNFIYGKWNNIPFVVESLKDGKLLLRMNRAVGLDSYFPPYQACLRYMGLSSPVGRNGQTMVRQCFI